MAELKYYIKGFEKPFSTAEKDERTSVDIKDKPKIYFTCHPKDFGRYFEKVRGDLFRAGDCVIFYTEDMTEQLDDENREIDLERMNLFVMPVTFRMLTEPNRALDEDFAFAEAKHISVLPLMMESGIDEFYAKRFGTRQYLEPYSADQTAVSYEDKLKNYFKSVFLDEEMIKRIRGMFDAYIFLSYRKKDRRYANELMRMIHNDPQLEKLAIWYDEFLTPTESFSENIQKYLNESKLFTLLVTPNLLEKPNYVMDYEYPDALKISENTGMPILPAEMVSTDSQALKDAYKDIPETVDVHDEQQFHEQILNSLHRYAVSENREDPEHNYLIGRAYLEGIDVEIDKERGLRLITAAAEAEYPDAILQLINMYYKGESMTADPKEVLKWTQRLYDYSLRTSGSYSEDTVRSLLLLSYFNNDSDNIKECLKLANQADQIISLHYQNDEKMQINALSALAVAYNGFNDIPGELRIRKKCYQLLCKAYGELHRDTLTELSQIALAYSILGNDDRAIHDGEKSYQLLCDHVGEKKEAALSALDRLVTIYERADKPDLALKHSVDSYQLHCDVDGEENIRTLSVLTHMAALYNDNDDIPNALEYSNKGYELSCKYYGKTGSQTIDALSILASAYGKSGDQTKDFNLHLQCVALVSEELGQNHPNTLKARFNLAHAYTDYKRDREALPESQKCYMIGRHVFGRYNFRTQEYLSLYLVNLCKCGQFKQLDKLCEDVYRHEKYSFEPLLLTVYTMYKLTGRNRKKAQVIKRRLDLLKNHE